MPEADCDLPDRLHVMARETYGDADAYESLYYEAAVEIANLRRQLITQADELKNKYRRLSGCPPDVDLDAWLDACEEARRLRRALCPKRLHGTRL